MYSSFYFVQVWCYPLLLHSNYVTHVADMEQILFCYIYVMCNTFN